MNVDQNGLPEFCYTTLSSTEEVVMIKRYEKGYYPSRPENLPWYGQGNANAANEKLGISKDQELAMVHGSMFGWDKIGAKPVTWQLRFNEEEWKLKLAEEKKKKNDEKLDYTSIVNQFEEDFVKKFFPEGWEIIRNNQGMLWSICGNIPMSDGKDVFIVFTTDKMAYATFNDDRSMYLTKDQAEQLDEEPFGSDALLMQEYDESKPGKIEVFWESLLSKEDMEKVVSYFELFLKMLDTYI